QRLWGFLLALPILASPANGASLPPRPSDDIDLREIACSDFEPTSNAATTTGLLVAVMWLSGYQYARSGTSPDMGQMTSEMQPCIEAGSPETLLSIISGSSTSNNGPGLFSRKAPDD